MKWFTLLVGFFVFCFAASVVAWLAVAQVADPQTPRLDIQAVQYEYLWEVMALGDKTRLNQLGSQGWDVVTAVRHAHSTNGVYCLLKRVKGASLETIPREATYPAGPTYSPIPDGATYRAAPADRLTPSPPVIPAP